MKWSEPSLGPAHRRGLGPDGVEPRVVDLLTCEPFIREELGGEPPRSGVAFGCYGANSHAGSKLGRLRASSGKPSEPRRRRHPDSDYTGDLRQWVAPRPGTFVLDLGTKVTVSSGLANLCSTHGSTGRTGHARIDGGLGGLAHAPRQFPGAHRSRGPGCRPTRHLRHDGPHRRHPAADPGTGAPGARRRPPPRGPPPAPEHGQELGLRLARTAPRRLRRPGPGSAQGHHRLRRAARLRHRRAGRHPGRGVRLPPGQRRAAVAGRHRRRPRLQRPRQHPGAGLRPHPLRRALQPGVRPRGAPRRRPPVPHRLGALRGGRGPGRVPLGPGPLPGRAVLPVQPRRRPGNDALADARPRAHRVLLLHPRRRRPPARADRRSAPLAPGWHARERGAHRQRLPDAGCRAAVPVGRAGREAGGRGGHGGLRPALAPGSLDRGGRAVRSPGGGAPGETGAPGRAERAAGPPPLRVRPPHRGWPGSSACPGRRGRSSRRCAAPSSRCTA